jgi:hypothetical protein
MNIRGQFSDYFETTALPALNAKIWQTFNATPPMFNKVLDVKTSSRDIEQFSQMVGVGLPAQIGEGEDIGVDSMVQGFNKTFRALKYGLGIGCTQELIEDDKVGIVSKRSVLLAQSVAQAREIQAASVLNNAFTTTGPDGKVLCASDHPLVKAGSTQSNILTAAADLDVTSLELALTDWELLKDHRGFLQTLSTPRVLAAPANRWNAAEILKGQMRSDTANNTVNAFKYAESGAVVDFLIWKYLTDPDAWFLVASPGETEMVWIDRKKPYTKSDYIEKNETGYVYMRYRSTVGFYGWKGIFGTPGA